MIVRTASDIQSLGSILSIWAHPDDETFTAGGVLAAAASNGQPVVCVTATRGEAGVQDEQRWPAASLGKIREQELGDALGILNISKHYWLDCQDGRCGQSSQSEIIAGLQSIAERFAPDTILTFGPDGWTGHPDHSTVSTWANLLADRLGKRPKIFHVVSDRKIYKDFLSKADERLDIFFNIVEPPLVDEQDCAIYYRLPKEQLDLKLKALRAMPSQTEGLFAELDERTIEGMFGLETFVQAK